MTPKYSAGQKVIWIEWNDEFKAWQVSNITIESIAIYIDSILYFPTAYCAEVPEHQLFTKEEAIKFLEEKLSDGK